MRKRTQKLAVYVIIGMVCISLIGTSFVFFMPPADDAVNGESPSALEQEYNARVQAVEQLKVTLQSKPEDLQTIVALADAYYKKSQLSIELNEEEYKEDLNNAVHYYQEALTKEEDTEVSLKLAASAFLLSTADATNQTYAALAEKTYKEILKKEPHDVDALYGYGMYLFYVKQNYTQAKEYWQTALKYNTDEEMKSNLEDMIGLAEGTEPADSEGSGQEK
ncbi:hypothetical protein LPY66_20580 [Dehalobacter sp. DCM]|uniref:tetratricopeptide repeat protein n=1 Tax=Dehalobacter sp. DCM TaxID=2907827 RepID=UPI003081AEFE|nr:hypothetical protein LPY66_20580 [Dehalobacter sp. DCM]